MKKIALLLAAVLLFGTMLTACGKTETGAATTDLTAIELAQKANEVAPVAMSAEADEMIATDIFHLNMDEVEDYGIIFTQVMVSVDHIAAVKAKEGCVENVAAALQQRKDDVVAAFEMYLPDRYDCAQNGLVFTIGDWAFLVIHDDAEKAEETIRAQFN